VYWVHGKAIVEMLMMFQAAFEAYKERELPNLRKEHPGLRLQQYQVCHVVLFPSEPSAHAVIGNHVQELPEVPGKPVSSIF